MSRIAKPISLLISPYLEFRVWDNKEEKIHRKRKKKTLEC